MKPSQVFRLSILLFLFSLPCFVFGQYWKRTTTDDYEHQTETLDSLAYPTTSVERLSLPAILPVVVHVVYPKQEEILEQEAIEWQVTQLNKHFSLEEFYEKKEIVGEHKYHKLAVDTEIRFCLDKVSFVPSDSSNFKNYNSIKNDLTGGVTAIKPEDYINIWVGPITNSSGYAFRMVFERHPNDY